MCKPDGDGDGDHGDVCGSGWVGGIYQVVGGEGVRSRCQWIDISSMPVPDSECERVAQSSMNERLHLRIQCCREQSLDTGEAML